MAQGQIDLAAVEAAVSDFADPETGRSALRMNQIRDIEVSGNAVALTLALTTHSAAIGKDVRQALEDRLRSRLPQLESITIREAVHKRPPQKLGQVGLTAKSVIAVGSGKGGVGKSTIAASLAFGLKRVGSKVGLLDADVYGPSIPLLTGTAQASRDDLQGPEGLLRPVQADGMPIMSLGYLIEPGQAVIWRGPMLHKAVTQFLTGTDWGELDYLVVDMPPGTGDVALSLSQSLPLTGAIVVCTPQDVALLDAVKAISMFRTVKIPILGMVENMSGFICPSCQTKYDIFGSGGARRRAEQLDVPFLGEVPINIQIRVSGDEGRTLANLEDPAIAPYLEGITHTLVSNLAEAARRKPPQPGLPVLG